MTDNSDFILRMVAREASVRGLVAVTTGLARDGVRRHDTTGASSLALAETLTAGILMGGLLKVGHRVALKFEGNGPLRKAVIEADSFGRVRGYVAESQLSKSLSVPDALGAAGLLTVVKDVRLKELVEGVVPLATSHVDQDLSHYLNHSEQLPSLVVIGAKAGRQNEIAAAGGVLIQALPPHNPQTLAVFRERLLELPPIEALLSSGRQPEAIVAELFADIPYDILEKRPARFECHCSRERSRQALILIGRDEVAQILAEQGRAVVDCHFCHAQYVFEQEELVDLLEELSQAPPP